MPNDFTITITHGDPSTGKLTIDYDETTPIPRTTRIHWKIDPNSNVATIDKIHRKKESTWIFFLGPHRQRNNWTGKIVHAPKPSTYHYYINWTEKNTWKTYNYDPKIPVKPRTRENDMSFLFIIIGVLILFRGCNYLIKKMIQRFRSI